MANPLRSSTALLFASVLLFAGGAEAAKADGVRIDQFQPASPESPFFRTEGPHKSDLKGVEFAAGVTFDYGSTELRELGIDSRGKSTTLARLVENALLLHAGGSITPVHWLAFDIAMPFALFENGQAPKPYAGFTPNAVDTAGAGDPRIGVHLRPIDKNAFGLLVGARFWAPFGSRGTYLSDASARVEIDAGIAGEVRSSLYGAMLSLSPGLFAGRNGDRVALSAAWLYKVQPAFAVGLEPSFELLEQQQQGASHKGFLAPLFEPLAAVRAEVRVVRIGLAAGPGFGSGPGVASFRALLNVGFVVLGKPPPAPKEKPADRDLDGILDKDDACPDEAGPPNKDPKLNGCPIHDRDGDGVPDDVDACPDTPGIRHANPKGNGCPDSDNDTIPDPIDECPHEPGPAPSGCPKFARLGKDGFTVEPPITFVKDEKLTVDSKAALDEIAATMQANPKFEQVSIGVGTKGAKPDLADKRAQQILLVMRAASLDSNRYEVVLRDDLPAGKVVVRILGP